MKRETIYIAEIKTRNAREAMNNYAQKHGLPQERDGSFEIGGVCVGFDDGTEGGWCAPNPTIETSGYERRTTELITRDIAMYARARIPIITEGAVVEIP